MGWRVRYGGACELVARGGGWECCLRSGLFWGEYVRGEERVVRSGGGITGGGGEIARVGGGRGYVGEETCEVWRGRGEWRGGKRRRTLEERRWGGMIGGEIGRSGGIRGRGRVKARWQWGRWEGGAGGRGWEVGLERNK